MAKVVRKSFALDDPELQKKHPGDRPDGVFLKDVDAMHIFMGLIQGKRTENEAFISERIDLTNMNRYIEEKNLSEDEFKYTLFHIIVTAGLKTFVLRPKLNRFFANKKLYQRRELTAAFVVKKRFHDESEEGLAVIKADVDDTSETIHEKLRCHIYPVKKGHGDKTSDAMNILNTLPPFILKIVAAVLRFLAERGRVPKSLIASDPNWSSIFLTNLGSIKLKAGYHHLANWGTNSAFIVVGEKKMRPVFNDDGSFEMRDTLDIGFTLDERIADGYYFSKSVRLLKTLLENPWLLDRPLKEEIEY